MKRLFFILIIIILFFVLCINYNNINNLQNYYSTCMIVTNLDYVNDLVTLTDWNGEMYAFTGCEDWLIGDRCSVIMYNNTTESILDDIIIQVKYCYYLT